MRKMMVLFFCCCITYLSNAQSPRLYKVPKERQDSGFKQKFPDWNFDSLAGALADRNKYDHMPLAGAMPKRMTYTVNNGKGFDIYQTPYDNMYILKPDSTFSSNMPVAGGSGISMKPIEMPNPRKERRD